MSNYKDKEEFAGERRSFAPRKRMGASSNRNNGENQRDGFKPRRSFGGNSTGQGYNQNRREGYKPRKSYNPNFSHSSRGGYGEDAPRKFFKKRAVEGETQERGAERRGYNNREQGAYGASSRNAGGTYKKYGERRTYGGGERGGYGQSRGGYQGGNFDKGERTGYRKTYTSDYDPHAKYSHKKRIKYKQEHIDPNEPIRLNKYLANAGICSRRDADKYIEAGVVTVNGKIITELGVKVAPVDEVRFNNALVRTEKKVYLLLNKPKGFVTTSDDPQNRRTVMDLVRGACRERIYPVGRLDRNTTGVLMFTNDGDLSAKLTHPQYMKKKIYHVQLDKNVTAADMRQILEGFRLEDGEVKADDVQYVSEEDRKQVGIEIHNGRNRIVRRIFEHLGYNVIKLDRVYFAGLTKKRLKRGDWRFLTEDEVNFLRMGSFE